MSSTLSLHLLRWHDERVSCRCSRYSYYQCCCSRKSQSRHRRNSTRPLLDRARNPRSDDLVSMREDGAPALCVANKGTYVYLGTHAYVRSIILSGLERDSGTARM